MITFWVPRDAGLSFPSDHSFTNKEGKKVSLTIEHCGGILPPYRQGLRESHLGMRRKANIGEELGNVLPQL